MQAPERKPLSRKTADALEREIRNGHWKTQLPGYRKLCEALSVSPRTMREALSLLTRRNVLLPAERTKPHCIHPDFLESELCNQHRKSLLIITNLPIPELSIIPSLILERTVLMFTKKGWTINFEVSSDLDRGTPGPSLEKMLENHGNHRWLLLSPSFKIVQWCMSNNIRAVCLGGETETLKPPLITVSVSDKLKDAVQRLSKLGHKKISSIIHLPTEQSRENVIHKIQGAFTSSGIDFHPSYNLPQLLNDDFQGLWDCLNSLFTHSPPTAIIVTEIHQLITLYSFCLSRGLQIPRDLSVIVTKESRNVEWFYPLPTHYLAPISQYVSHLQRNIEHYPTGEVEPVFLKPEFIKGQSISRPK